MNTGLVSWTILPLIAVLSIACSTSAQSPEPSPTPFLRAGDEARLFFGNTDKLVLTTDKQAFDALWKAREINDTYGMLELINAGKVFEIDNSIKVLLLERGTTFGVTTRWKVRVREGTNTGKAGWAPKSWVDSS